MLAKYETSGSPLPPIAEPIRGWKITHLKGTVKGPKALNQRQFVRVDLA